MEKTIINIQDEVIIKAEGEKSGGNCMCCMIVETGERFTSQIDLAKRLGTSPSAVSNAIRGNQRTCKGYHIIAASRIEENVDVILDHLYEASKDKEDARKWREYQAEQERIRKEEEDRIEAERKAKEKFETDKQKAIARIVRRKEIAARLATKFDEASARIIEAEKEYYDLTGEHYGDSITA